MVYSEVESIRVSAGRWLDRAAFGALLLLTTFFAFEQVRPIFRSNLVVFTNVEIFLVTTIALWLLSRLASSRPLRYPRQLSLPVALWVGALLLSTALAPAFQDKALLFMGRMLAGLLVGWAAYDLADSDFRWRAMLLAMAGGSVAVALLALAEGFALAPVVAWLARFKYAQTRVGDVLRVSATLSYATITAMVLELAVPVALALALVARKGLIWLLATAGIVIILVAQVLTLSRAGVLALLAAMTVMAVAGLWRRDKTLVLATLGTSGLLLALVALVLFGNPTARLRLTTETEQEWYQVAYVAPETIQARPGQFLVVPVQLTNTGVRAWLDEDEQPFALSYHLYDEAGEPVNFDGTRTWLSAPVEPGQVIVIEAQIETPAEPGEYRLEWDMVQETVTWFSWKDAPTVDTILAVAGSAVEPASTATSVPIDVKVVNPTPGRFDLWGHALAMAANYPLLGVGPDSFRWQYGAYAGLGEWNTSIHANNLYLEWLADTGLIGLLLFLWFSWRLARMGLNHLCHLRQRTTWLLVLGLTASLTAWYVHGFFDYFYEFTPTYVAFWLLVGLLAGAPQRRQNVVTDRI